jgi:hypothetical protein
MKAFSTIFVLAALGLSLSPTPSMAQRLVLPPPPTACIAACGGHGYSPGEASGPAVCADKLGQFAIIHARDIRSIVDGRKVRISPICETLSLTGNDPHALLGKGNVDGLRLRIATNPVLARKLAAGGYRADDVVAIVFGRNDAVTVYVHKRRA